MRTFTPTARISTLWAVAALAVGGCTDSGLGPWDHRAGGLTGGTEVLFFVQTVIPNAYMEALYRGPVSMDVEGCLRLRPPDDATVIWPKGFRLDIRTNGLFVLDPAGVSIGRVGSAFQFGGGEVAELHEGIGISAAERAAAQEHCPGRYWIVGEVTSG